MSEPHIHGDAYARAWRDLSWRRRTAVLSIVVGPPFVCTVALLLGHFIGSGAAPITVFALGVPWGIGSFVAQIRLMFFRCPRCGSFFRHPGGRLFAQICRVCGLRVGQGLTLAPEHQ